MMSRSAASKKRSGSQKPKPHGHVETAISNEWRMVAMVGLGALAFFLMPVLPAQPQFAGIVDVPLAFRGVAAGLVVGLLGRNVIVPRLRALLAFVAVLLGGVVLVAIAPGAVGIGGLLGAILLAPGLAVAVPMASPLGSWVPEAVALTAIMLMSLWLAGFLPGPLQGKPAQQQRHTLDVATNATSYSFDGVDFARTYALMKGGMGYYQAFDKAVTADSRHGPGYIRNPFNYREPLLFEIWRILPGSNANDLLRWFMLWGLGLMLASYALARNLAEPGVALLAPIGIATYLTTFWWGGSWFLVTELWASLFVVAAVWALVTRRWAASLVLLLLAAATREFTIVLVPAWLVTWWFGALEQDRRQTWWFPATATLLPAIPIVIHVFAAPRLGPGTLGGVTQWFHGGFDILFQVLLFGWGSMTGTSIAGLMFVAAALTAIGLAQPTWKRAALTAAVAAPILYLLFFSAGYWHYYWGAAFTPLFVAIAPGVLGSLFPPSTPRALAAE